VSSDLLELEIGKSDLFIASIGRTELRIARETVARMVAVHVTGTFSY
jgi:hypothetical protein